MRKQIAAVLGVALLSTGALASKARLEALGEDAGGSQFIDDARNIFLNPAHLNYHKDFATFEWGDTTKTGDATGTPRSEGGVFKAEGNMVYGVYFGGESNTSNSLRTAAMASGTADANQFNNVITERNNTELFVAGDAGIQWGAKLTYHSYEDETADAESSALRAIVGVITGDLEGYANIGLGNKAESGDEEIKGNASLDVGGTFHAGSVDYTAQFQTIDSEDTEGDGFKAQLINVGVAKAYKLNDKASLWVSAKYVMNSYECDLEGEYTDGTDTKSVCAITGRVGAGDEKANFLPASIALEVEVKDWLTLRGSVTQNIIGTTELDNGDKQTIDNTTSVRAGASIVFGDFALDGVIGNNGAGDATPGADTADGSGVLRTDALMSRVSMTYKF